MKSEKEKSLRKHAVGMVILLILQYLLGMNVNLFVHFPESGTAAIFWEFARSQLTIILHMSVGLGLVLGTIALLVRSIKYKNEIWRTSSIISTVCVLVAFLSGIQFISTQNDLYSYLMATGFIAAALSYGWAFYISKVN